MSETSPRSLAPVDAWGFRVHPGTAAEYLDFTGTAIRERRRLCLFDHNLHSLYEYFRDPAFRRLYDGATVMIDGMSLVLLLRLAGVAAERRHRITWVDYIWPLLERAEAEGWRIFYLGSARETHDRALTIIRARLPRLRIAGQHGYFDATPGSRDNARIVRTINDFRADVCLVGMGTPLQQQWIATHRPVVEAPVMVFCGACMEFVAGTARTPPRWTGRLGLEWLYRLWSNPKRFAHRYLVEPWLLCAMMLSHRLRDRPPRP